ncbi:phosphatidylglycerophosphatase [Emydomyces testavorans]|uniref:Phosphatidylglycerophosphatase n=1 Tax=Emydomyces testavorans TaxID=2070801 RepID=A0AAF0IMH3_9EURO|nr:phosphatidylglycerophosphatase [Emydomyces testavorans]
MRPLNTNIPAFSLTISTLLRHPSHLLPNLTIPTLPHLPLHLGPHLLPPSSTQTHTHPPPTIRALILDKDNTLTPPNRLSIPPSHLTFLHSLRTSPTSPFHLSHNPHGILLVSNTSGSNPSNLLYAAEADALESLLADLQIPVFRAPPQHEGGRTPFNKKPFSHRAILTYLTSRGVVDSPAEIAVVGDRLGTDVLMASLMGAWSVWVRDGVTEGAEGEERGRQGMDYRGVLAKMEMRLERYLRRRGVKPSVPKGW